MADHKIEVGFFRIPLEVESSGKRLRRKSALPADCQRIIAVGVVENLTTRPMQYNVRRYGTGPAGQNTEAFVLTLTRENLAEAGNTFLVNAGPGEKIYYAHPRRLGTVLFEYGDVVGGFTGPVVVAVTDPETGASEEYYLWESLEDNLSETEVEIKQRS